MTSGYGVAACGAPTGSRSQVDWSQTPCRRGPRAAGAAAAPVRRSAVSAPSRLRADPAGPRAILDVFRSCGQALCPPSCRPTAWLEPPSPMPSHRMAQVRKPRCPRLRDVHRAPRRGAGGAGAAERVAGCWRGLAHLDAVGAPRRNRRRGGRRLVVTLRRSDRHAGIMGTAREADTRRRRRMRRRQRGVARA
jgi:hypothetical protein